MKYNISLSLANKIIYISGDGDAVPAGTTNVGSFDHPDDNDSLDYSGSHVEFHHIRDAMYKVDNESGLPNGFWPENITNFQEFSIVRYGPQATIELLQVKPTSATVEEESTVNLVVSITPTEASAITKTYTSADETIATVSNAGVITGIAEGETEITVTAGRLSQKITVTVTAKEEPIEP